jgi:beta-phosphoglucomutase-like phosphatase (HAD superfamily)
VKALLVDLDGTIMNSTSAIVKGRCEAGGERDCDSWEEDIRLQRPLVVDTQGLILRVLVHPADVHHR